VRCAPRCPGAAAVQWAHCGEGCSREGQKSHWNNHRCTLGAPGAYGGVQQALEVHRIAPIMCYSLRQ
jgi:hypothetical protein